MSEKILQPKLNRNKNAVKVQNVPLNVNRREVVALFTTLIGDVHSWSEVTEPAGSYLKLSFFTRDAARKAFCMSGYTIAGSPLVVTSMEDDVDTRSQAKRQNERRNLYVLGLPYDLTKSEFTQIFSRYGQVAHCVLLATVDNASRRRGFVVMASHEAAKRAMAALTRTQIQGHVIDVSWAIVQRSQGFLDGGDRTMVFDSRLPRECSPDTSSEDDGSSHKNNSSDSSLDSDSSTRSDLSPLTASLLPSAALLVTNLPTLLFSEKSDLHPLFYPYGKIKKLEILASKGTTSVIVEYASVESAREAKENIQRHCYAEHQVKAQYVHSSSSSPSTGVPMNLECRRDASAMDFASSFHPSFQPHRYQDNGSYSVQPGPSGYAPYGYIPIHTYYHSAPMLPRSAGFHSRPWTNEWSQYPSRTAVRCAPGSRSQSVYH
ncbi:hypothetical protein C8J56DRAFT_815384 [Mycena floridula]|nr:hypothetical protein C8J56DRAFT_815384 [Mycena floridula]